MCCIAKLCYKDGKNIKAQKLMFKNTRFSYKRKVYKKMRLKSSKY